MLDQLRRQIWAGAAALLAGTGLFLSGIIMGQLRGEAAPVPVPAALPLRFQVLAHSDHPADQALKVRVRDAVLPVLQQAGREARDAGELAAAIPGLLPELEAAARAELRAAGSDQQVRAEFGFKPFPERRYGGLTFPAGEYPTLRLALGAGAGQNWWCVLFPPLCFPESVSHVAVRGGGEGPPAGEMHPGGGPVPATAVTAPLVGPDNAAMAAALARAGAPLVLDEREISELPVEARWALADWLRAHGWLSE